MSFGMDTPMHKRPFIACMATIPIHHKTEQCIIHRSRVSLS